MLKILAFILDALLCLTFVLGLLVLLFFISQAFQIPTPVAYQESMTHLFRPMVAWVHGVYGHPVSDFQGRKLDMTYGVLLVHVLVSFVVLFVVAGTLHRMDQRLTLWFRETSHRFFLRRMRHKTEKQQEAVQIQRIASEQCCLVAVGFQNMDHHSGLAEFVQRYFRQIPYHHHVYEGDWYYLLRFDKTMAAHGFMRALTRQFVEAARQERINFEFKPAFRVVLHTLVEGESPSGESPFIEALLKCVGDNQVFLSASAKEFLEKQAPQADLDHALDITQVGTFAKLGDRTFPDVYRLKLT